MNSPLRFRYQTCEFGEHDIHYRSLRDKQQFEDINGEAEALGISSACWPIFGVLWPSGEVLARLMEHYDIKGRRILEVGCGLGLASLLLNERMADITATDNHPCAGSYLQHNAGLNNGRTIPFLRADWDDKQNDELGEFDLIIGSDLLYESQHADSLSVFIERYAKAKCEIIIIDGARGHGGKFAKRMATLGYSQQQTIPIKPNSGADNYKGKINTFERVARI
jgi:ETFB lysine methyltransferase